HGLGVGVHGTLTAGASLMLRPRFEPAETLAVLAEGACTMFFGVPTIYTRLIQEAARQAGGPQISAVRLFVSGSAPLSPQTFAAFEAAFGQRILERYGMTETGMNLTNPYDGERRPGTVGGPFPGQEARIVAVQGREPLPNGEVGEIQVRGPHLFAGYWRNPEATAEVLAPDGWFSTGDLGWRGEDGYYTITGRARELIISGGYNVYPREVEEHLLSHPGVAECAVFGAPDADLGERVFAAVVPRDPAAPPAPAELDAFCREGLAAYKRPRNVFYVKSLPRNAMGKVQKHELKACLG
ncbi:MAG: AMP-binding protein, partial [Chloroflexales bacterium]|nr:AMP-binding protein [Chloroflexales bacterium]